MESLNLFLQHLYCDYLSLGSCSTKSSSLSWCSLVHRVFRLQKAENDRYNFHISVSDCYICGLFFNRTHNHSVFINECRWLNSSRINYGLFSMFRSLFYKLWVICGSDIPNERWSGKTRCILNVFRWHPPLAFDIVHLLDLGKFDLYICIWCHLIGIVVENQTPFLGLLPCQIAQKLCG